VTIAINCDFLQLSNYAFNTFKKVLTNTRCPPPPARFCHVSVKSYYLSPTYTVFDKHTRKAILVPPMPGRKGAAANTTTRPSSIKEPLGLEMEQSLELNFVLISLYSFNEPLVISKANLK
jgi:hypothetical protein